MKRKKVAILDDRPQNRERYADYLAQIGYDPAPYDQCIQSLEILENDIKADLIKWLICDHRLNEGKYATFLGAQAVARFYEAQIPALLLTGFEKTDADTTIRPFRQKIPVLLHNIDVTPAKIEEGFEIAYREVVENLIPPERQPCRSIMTVTDIVPKGDISVVKVILTQWDSSREVGFPASMLPGEISGILKPDLMLIADVNVDAEKAEDLFFANFTIPEKDVLNSI